MSRRKGRWVGSKHIERWKRGEVFGTCSNVKRGAANSLRLCARLLCLCIGVAKHNPIPKSNPSAGLEELAFAASVRFFVLAIAVVSLIFALYLFC